MNFNCASIFYASLKKAKSQNTDADNITFSIDLSNFFYPNGVEINELDTNDIPDADMCELMNNVMPKNATNCEQVEVSKNQADEKASKPKRNKTRFAQISDEQVNKIAENKCAPTTWKQTTWDVKIFKGIFSYLN